MDGFSWFRVIMFSLIKKWFKFGFIFLMIYFLLMVRFIWEYMVKKINFKSFEIMFVDLFCFII